MSLDLEILVPDGVVLHTRINSFRGADASGHFGLLPGHEDFATLLTPCVMIYRDEEEREHYAAADGGVLLLEKGRISITTREAVVADRLDQVAEAVAAILEARRAKEKTARGEFAELQSTLLKELRKMEPRT